ncbi:MAG: RsmD family RNA methyltransferase, partial [Acidimicrobiales bacterium]
MRIIGGSARGRKLVGPSSEVTRPLSDRARESLFNILG